MVLTTDNFSILNLQYLLQSCEWQISFRHEALFFFNMIRITRHVIVQIPNLTKVNVRLRTTLLFLVSLLSVQGFAQKKSITDSLWQEFNNTQLADTVRLKSLHSMAVKFAFVNPDSAIVLGHKQLAFAQSRKALRYESAAYNTIGISFLNMGNLDSALVNYSKSLVIRRQIVDGKGEAASLNNIGIVYYQRGDYPRAIEYYQLSLNIKDSLGDMLGVAASYSNIGMIYENEGKIDLTLVYYNKALHIRDSLNDLRGLCDSYSKIAGYYMMTRDYENAEIFLDKSIDYAQQAGDDRSLSSSLSNIGHLFEIREQDDSAIVYYQKALAIRLKLGDEEGIARSHVEIGSFYFDQRDFLKAIENCKIGLDLSDKIDFPEIQRDGCNCLAEAFEATGNTRDALFYYKRATTIDDSLSGIEKSNEITRKLLQYEFEKEQLADSLARKTENELTDVRHTQEMKQQKIFTYMGIAGCVLMVALAFVLFRGYRIKQSTNLTLERKNALIEEKQKEILDSITYAKRLQEAILPSFETMNKFFADNFILYKPKDIVAGDFYWLEHVNGITFVAAADCTGHGVPGAMVSVVCSNALNRSVLEFGITDTGKILEKTRELVLETFSKSDKDVKDGMDISLLAINHNTKETSWSGANNPLWIVRKVDKASPEFIEIKADKQPIGKTEHPQPFTTHTITVSKGDHIYLFTDGYADQFGGPKGKKFKYLQLKELLINTANLTPVDQNHTLDVAFEKWRGNLEQVDDVCIIGIRL